MTVVWIVEFRQWEKDSTVFGVCSTRDSAIAYAKEHLDALQEEPSSWFTIYDQTVDAPFSGNDCELISVDRVGDVSNEIQPCYPPHLINPPEDKKD